QLRGDAGDRQVDAARSAVITGGMAGTNRSTILVSG
ncbi:hypothetical protein, partial [Frankia sp. CpI1-P]